MLIEDRQILDVQSLAIPRADLHAIRVIYHMDEESSASWQIQLTWDDQQRVILSGSRYKGAPVVCLAEVLAIWAGFTLRWKSPTTSAKLYDRVGSVDVVHGAEPAVSTTVIQFIFTVTAGLLLLFGMNLINKLVHFDQHTILRQPAQLKFIGLP